MYVEEMPLIWGKLQFYTNHSVISKFLSLFIETYFNLILGENWNLGWFKMVFQNNLVLSKNQNSTFYSSFLFGFVYQVYQ